VADEPNTPEKPDVNVMMDPRDMGGVWANFARVSHSEHEFTIDFVRLDHTMSPVQGIVVARVNVSPLFVTQLVDALNSNWEKFARKAMPREVRHDNDDS
jgi:hypothetical protein